MDENIVTLIIGLAGIVSTLISSGLGLFFIARARRAPLRELLFNRQVELITKILRKQELFRIYSFILNDANYPHKDQIRKDVAQCIRDFVEFEGEGMAILPVELWVEIKNLSNQMSSILTEYDNNKIVTEASIITYVARCAKVSLISRAIVGADELTEESIKLFSSKKEYNNLTGIEVSFLEKAYDKKNIKKKGNFI